ncbi:MAG TPA: glycoside hydrolase family 2 TIM barrel-domain containing protein [Tepidisphaeraceae bacterium]|jgi:hypothetical protein|nr:glycoside hydrolase family 2 TIM barrel-domain containing protein [Tepidisphaeraceae bacterium]
MLKRILGGAAVLGWVMGMGGVARGEEWAAKTGPLMTRWAKDVSPEKVWGEYPRPQMVRSDWMNLNGVWEYRKGQEGEKVGFGKELPGKILVPFPVESALSGVMEHLDRMVYRRTFTVPSEWGGKRVLLHFGAVDWGCSVYINKKKVGTHRGGYDAFTYDVTDRLKKGTAEQEVEVVVWDPTDVGDQPRGKQVNDPHGIFYTSTTGIWQTVWLEPVSQEHIEEVKMVPDVAGKYVRVTALGTAQEVDVKVMAGGTIIAEQRGRGEMVIPMAEAHLWSPEDPYLYDLEVSAGQDSVKSYFGMRSIAIAKDEKGVNRIMLNGKALFEVGMLDQGFWPDGIYTAPSDEAMKFDIEQQKKLGFNLIRKHVKVEPARWYYWCDHLGMLVWQDMPSADNKTEKGKEEYQAELKRLVETHWNSPSIVMWVVFNEGWGEFDVPKVVAEVKRLDPTRLVDNASGWTDAGVGDVVDMHLYPGPGAPKTEEKRAAVLGEFGGLGLATWGHLWKSDRNFSYAGQESAEGLTEQYVRLLSKAWELNASAGLSACIYTQTTDVEGEINGVMTYDRVLKGDAEQIRQVNLGKGPKFATFTVVPSALEGGQTWRYTTDKPGEGWTKSAFDDSAWKQGPSGFGVGQTPGGIVRTKWETGDIWLRRDMEIPAGIEPGDLKLWMHHDDGCEVYINGVLATRRSHAVSGYEEQPLSKQAQGALVTGKNEVAVHCSNTGGPGYIDVGLVRVEEKRGD